MRLSIKLNLNTLVASSFSDPSFYFMFDDISDLENWYDEEENVTALEFEKGSSNTYTMYVFVNDDTSPLYDARGGDIVDLSKTGTYIKFTCEFTASEINRLVEFIQKGIIKVDQDGTTAMIAYRLNDEKDKLTKNLTPVTIIKGSFKAPLGIKNIEIDVVNYDIDNSYNYIYIPKLKRYYYVTNIQLSTKDFTHLILQEDVLMSWKDLIKSQKMQIARYEYSQENFIIDERLPLESRYKVTYQALDSTTTGSLVNCTLNYAPSGSLKRNFLITTITTRASDNETTIYGASKPTGTTLPDIAPRKPYNKHYYALSYIEYHYFVSACLKNTNTVDSFIINCLWLPFVPNENATFVIKILQLKKIK